MSDWDKDEFMSQWDKKYVSTNLKPGARQYGKDFFLGLHAELITSHPGLQDVAYTLIAAACCAVGRADAVGRFFDDITVDATPEESERIFLRLREAVTIIFPYLGMPTCIPACYGMIGVIQRKGQSFASTKVLRKLTVTEEDTRKGSELRAKIYSGGYLIAKANEEVFELYESHLVVATAITALGATR
ncbi:hypothetical protein LTR10_023363 [Elasticomyces elasticus]|uniref:Uncharacterized protein n=1 Tax=Exophiala sideris TaxID=1016849 RepID=A0ABR0IWG1_9EURO|nr:hypothetical protein LTR10_023363 [Elasticomyces elasticus]KAK5023154.1 hypothetical protein LTR13_011298 [Exophiala sideris]KAK5023376.1 hypothetical protein LTS07_009251 [Exophiala sideris]KAK5048738.1 hypothetical protein LTR69_011329 [Exophiala sideris]KAK5176140.1 hypothetical protein LTR44_011319 [Eurotiomycetes sp. CCFEE 6388]